MSLFASVLGEKPEARHDEVNQQFVTERPDIGLRIDTERGRTGEDAAAVVVHFGCQVARGPLIVVVLIIQDEPALSEQNSAPGQLSANDHRISGQIGGSCLTERDRIEAGVARLVGH